jgi:hypothetical protein
VLTVPRVTLGLAAALLVVSGVAVACSQDDAPGADGATTPLATPAATPTAPATPSAGPASQLEVPGVELTEQGSALELGEPATVAWEPDQRTVGALEVVVRAVERAPMSVFGGWRLDDATRASAAYFVRARIDNVGESDLSGVQVPLYAVDGDDTLIQHSSFASRFRPCPSEPFPPRFRPGRSTEVCLVYLVPDKGDLTAVSFRPVQAFDPITWTGEETTYRAGAGERGSRGRGGAGRDRDAS